MCDILIMQEVEVQYTTFLARAVVSSYIHGEKKVRHSRTCVTVPWSHRRPISSPAPPLGWSPGPQWLLIPLPSHLCSTQQDGKMGRRKEHSLPLKKPFLSPTQYFFYLFSEKSGTWPDFCKKGWKMKSFSWAVMCSAKNWNSNAEEEKEAGGKVGEFSLSHHFHSGDDKAVFPFHVSATLRTDCR